VGTLDYIDYSARKEKCSALKSAHGSASEQGLDRAVLSRFRPLRPLGGPPETADLAYIGLAATLVPGVIVLRHRHLRRDPLSVHTHRRVPQHRERTPFQLDGCQHISHYSVGY